MAKSFDYSKWDNIELSDDESDLHPNIDKDSWFRLKHRTRLEREEKEDHEVREYEAKNAQDEARVKLLQARLKGVESGEGDDAEFVDTEALELELKELQTGIDSRKKRIHDIQERRKWNIDNICKVKEDKTIVNSAVIRPLKGNDVDSVVGSQRSSEEAALENSPTAKALAENLKSTSLSSAVPAKPATATTPSTAATTVATPAAAAKPVSKGAEPAQSYQREKMAAISYNDYALKHEKVLEDYSEIHDLEATKEFLFKHCDILLHEHAMSYMLLSCLEDEMNGKHKRMKLVCRQSQILTHIHELGQSMRRDPRDVIVPFFVRISEAQYLQGFLQAVDDFIVKIQKRAVEKRKEMDAQQEEEEYEVQGEAPTLGEGGLDPIQVLKSLPIAMRRAFESQDIQRLQDVLSSMDPAQAKHYMSLCVKSGLWVAKDPTIFDEDAEGDGEEGDEGVAGESENVEN